MPKPRHQPDQPADREVASLVDLVNKATDAYIKGHIQEYLTFFDHPAECSLMAPYGGETVSTCNATRKRSSRPASSSPPVRAGSTSNTPSDRATSWC